MAATVVMVHGAWHGAWCFDRVLPLLHGAGVDAVAIDLPGHGDDAGDLTDLHGDAQRVAAVLDGLDGEVVLLGHSYGGAVITEAGSHPSVRELIYLAALLPDEGQSCMTAAGEAMAKASASSEPPTDTSADASKVPFAIEGELSRLTEEGARAQFMNDCDEDTTRWMLSRLGPQPMSNLAQVPNEISWRSKPSTYAVCTLDLAVPVPMQRVFASNCTRTVDLNAGHSVFASRPDVLADLLIQHVRALV